MSVLTNPAASSVEEARAYIDAILRRPEAPGKWLSVFSTIRW